MKKQVIIVLGIIALLLIGVAIRHAISDRKEVQDSQITIRTEIRDIFHLLIPNAKRHAVY